MPFTPMTGRVSARHGSDVIIEKIPDRTEYFGQTSSGTIVTGSRVSFDGDTVSRQAINIRPAAAAGLEVAAAPAVSPAWTSNTSVGARVLQIRLEAIAQAPEADGLQIVADLIGDARTEAGRANGHMLKRDLIRKL